MRRRRRLHLGNTIRRPARHPVAFGGGGAPSALTYDELPSHPEMGEPSTEYRWPAGEDASGQDQLLQMNWRDRLLDHEGDLGENLHTLTEGEAETDGPRWLMDHERRDDYWEDPDRIRYGRRDAAGLPANVESIPDFEDPWGGRDQDEADPRPPEWEHAFYGAAEPTATGARKGGGKR